MPWNGNNNNNNNNWKDWLKRNKVTIGATVLAGFVAYSALFNNRANEDEGYSTIENPNNSSYTALMEDNYITGVGIAGDTIIATDRSGEFTMAQIPRGRDPVEDFGERRIPVTDLGEMYAAQNNSNENGGRSALGGILGMLLPSILLIGVMLFVMNRMQKGQGGGTNRFGFGQSKSKMETSNLR